MDMNTSNGQDASQMSTRTRARARDRARQAARLVGVDGRGAICGVVRQDRRAVSRGFCVKEGACTRVG